MIYYCLLFIFHYLQDLVLQRAICILGHTHDQKIYYTSMSEPCADYLGEHNIHYIITRDLFSSLFPLTQTSSTISLKLRFRWFLGHAVISRIYLLEKISVKHIFQGEKGHKKWSLWWWSPFALTVLAPINFALLTFAEFRKSVEWRDQWKYWLKYWLHFYLDIKQQTLRQWWEGNHK